MLRAYKVCSTAEYRKAELDYVCKAFKNINGSPNWLIKDVRKKLEDGIISYATLENDNEQRTMMVLPYKGVQGEKLAKSLKRTLEKL